ncbi:hypothetical protein MX659_05475 [Coriobacteriia bacterium Es71-Z0120]|uniref:NADH-quinone oxidoreductase subunit N n=1 Tax=Parvivirga hydrogeniphila TaxID=2939460 RepID=UPI002260C5FF|nr:proton-conducting transporter membrane subunit [Parvivirga hydrogeniphila]MCL4079035.1 hypothetical protein [Parvivirga hydrogeniphila]
MSALSSISGMLWLPGAAVLAAGAAALLVDAFGRPGLGTALVGAAAVLASVLCAASASDGTIAEVVPGILGGGGLAGAAAVIYLLSAASLVTGLRNVPGSRRGGVAALIGVAAVASQALAGAADALVMAIALETIAIASFGIVAAGRGKASREVAIRYFVQASVAVGLLVFGLAGIVGLGGGATGYNELVQAMSSAPAAAASVLGVLLLAALAFKAGAFPFHSWVPDVYGVLEPEAAVFVAGAPKIAAVLALWLLFARSVWAGEAFRNVSVAIGVAAAASIIVGNFGALKQRDLGRMLGYSAIAQVGYALIGVSSRAVGTPLLVVSYAAAVAVAFGCLAALRSEAGDQATLESVAGVALKRPVLAGTTAVAMLSLTGVPLTVGFLGKLFVFYGAVSGGWTWLALIGAIGSVVSFGYYGRVIQAMYFAEPIAAPDETSQSGAAPFDSASPSPTGRARVWPFAILAAMLVAAGTVPLVTGFEWLLRLFTV